MIRKRKIGVLGGSFNPIHIGHILLADYLVQFSTLDEVWLMLSPLNPLKVHDGDNMVSDSLRLDMLETACSGHPDIIPCAIELTMPRPSYSIDSLGLLSSRYPECEFHLIIGSDNWNIFDKWRDWQTIIRRFRPIVYPRPGYPVDPASVPEHVTLTEAPVFDISSTFLRKAIAEGHDMELFLPSGVWDFIKSNKLYGYGNPDKPTDA